MESRSVSVQGWYREVNKTNSYPDDWNKNLGSINSYTNIPLEWSKINFHDNFCQFKDFHWKCMTAIFSIAIWNSCILNCHIIKGLSMEKLLERRRKNIITLFGQSLSFGFEIIASLLGAYTIEVNGFNSINIPVMRVFLSFLLVISYFVASHELKRFYLSKFSNQQDNQISHL